MMRQLFEDVQESLDSLLQSGYSSAQPSVGKNFSALGVRCEEHGLHTGAELMQTLSRLLEARGHTVEKDDLALTDAVCRVVRYLSLCREHFNAEETARRWQRAKADTTET